MFAICRWARLHNMITKEDLIAKREELMRERQSLFANINAVGGALELCEVLLAEIEKQEATSGLEK